MLVGAMLIIATLFAPLLGLIALRFCRSLALLRIPRLLSRALTKDALIQAARLNTPLVRLPGTHGLLVTDPRLARRLMEATGGAIVRDIEAYERYSGFLGGSLVLLPQATSQHRAMRSALLPLFSLGATRRAHDTLLECTQRLLAALEASSKPKRAVPLYRLLQHFVLDVTTSVFCAHSMSEADRKRLIAIFEEWLVDDGPRAPSRPPTRRSAAAVPLLATVEDWLRRQGRSLCMSLGPRATTKEAGSDDSDDGGDGGGGERLRRTYGCILDRLCAAMHTELSEGHTAQETGPETGPAASVLAALSAGDVGYATPPSATVRAQVAGLLFAGLNSAKELHAMLAMLARYPPLQAEVAAEVDHALEGRRPAYSDLSSTGSDEPRLARCAQLVHEALRLSPGIEHLRLVTTRAVTLDGAGGLTLPHSTRLVVSPSLLHHHPLHWPPPCEVPRPELFAAAAQAARAPGCFLPFSAGAKGCPAAGFALHEMRMLLAMVLQRFELCEASQGSDGVCVVVRQASVARREK